MNRFIAFLAAGVVAQQLLYAVPSAAQDNIYTAASGSWTASGNWNAGGVPVPNFDARAVIGSTVGSGAPTSVVGIASDIRASFPAPTVALGSDNATNGTLNITSSGALAVVNQGASDGNFVVGAGGTGTLNVSNNGILEIAADLSSGGGSSSAINLSDSATVSAATGFLDRNLTIDGSNVDLSFTGGLILGLAGTHEWIIPATGPATVSVGGNVDLGGTLKVQFPNGAPSAGSTLNLIDAGSVDGGEAVPSGFSFVDASAVPGLGVGERFATRTVGGGSNGSLVQLVLEQHPVLVVNRNTNEVIIRNPGSVDSIAVDTYAVTSEIGALDPTAWSSIAPADGWLQANPSANTLSELNPTGSANFTASTDLSLGFVLDRPAPAFGVENEDIRFRYSKPDGGFIEGDVIYTGLPNNTLTLVVDPTNGQTSIVNGTGFTVSIDNYNVRSSSGSLDFADGDPNVTWNSLEDQGANGGNWFEANASANLIAELLVDGGLTLAPNDSIALGSAWDPTGQQDLSFSFAILENASGDFNGDGAVNLADYTVWRDNLGATEDGDVLNGNGTGGIVDGDDYQLWKSNFGSTNSGGSPGLLAGKVLYESLPLGAISTVSAAAVPEPTSCVLLSLMVGGMFVSARSCRGTRPVQA